MEAVRVTSWQIYFTPRLCVILFFGFISGLPLALTASTLTAWLAQSHIDKSAIGLFAAVATPYTLKFLWSPLMDSLPVPLFTRLLGRRRGWILAMQILLIASLILLAFVRPDISPWATAAAALLVAFASASQDIVIDAYRVERLSHEEQGEGAAMAQLGYRLGMLASGAGALYLAAVVGWQSTYFIMAGITGIGIITTLLAKEPEVSIQLAPAHSFTMWFKASVVEPFADFIKRDQWLLVLLFILLYKLADAFIGIMSNPFLIELGFDLKDIARIVKIYGFTATIIGTFIGGSLTARFGAVRILFVAGFLHAITNLMYVWQAYAGADANVLAISVSVENITGGISAAAFVAYISNLCNLRYTATQYALLSSLAAFGRTWLSTPAGLVAKVAGWKLFFGLSALLALPGLFVLWLIHRQFKATSLLAAST